MRCRFFIVVLLGVIALLGACGSAESDPDGPDPPTTNPATTIGETSNPEDADPNIAHAEEAIAAWSANDTEAFWGYFDTNAVYAGYPADDPHTVAYGGFYMALHDTVTVSGCTTSTSIPGRVTCRARGVDQLSGPVGAAYKGEWLFDFVDGRIVAFDIYGGDISKIMFVEAMAAWVRDEHPDIWEATFVDADCSPARIDCWGPWAVSPETAAVMLQLGPEYRATLDA